MTGIIPDETQEGRILQLLKQSGRGYLRVIYPKSAFNTARGSMGFASAASRSKTSWKFPTAGAVAGFIG